MTHDGAQWWWPAKIIWVTVMKYKHSGKTQKIRWRTPRGRVPPRAWDALGDAPFCMLHGLQAPAYYVNTISYTIYMHMCGNNISWQQQAVAFETDD